MKKRKRSQTKPVPLLTMKPAEEEAKPRSSHSKRQLQLVTTTPFRLPDDWSVEEKRRPLSNTSNPGRIDKTYIEPGTGQRFRSLKAVERYVTEVNASAPLTALIPANESSPSSGSGSRKTISLDEILSQKVVSSSLKKNIPGKNDRPSKLKFGSPPAKVTWVLAGRGGNMWNSFIDDSKVPDSAKQKWSDTFVSSIYAGIISAPSS